MADVGIWANMQTMAGLGQPPTHAMREEWRHLSAETRRKVMDLIFARSRPSDADVIAGLQELGVSPELARWIVEEGLAPLVQAQRAAFERRMEVVIERTPLDYFNRLLASAAFFLLMLTWLTQDAIVMRSGEFPVSLPIATILALIGWTAFTSSLRRWLRSLKK